MTAMQALEMERMFKVVDESMKAVSSIVVIGLLSSERTVRLGSRLPAGTISM